MSSKMSSEAFNLTGIDPGVFGRINSAIHLGLFLLFSLPTIILTIMCIIAMLAAKKIKPKVKVNIINIFAADFTVSLGTTSFYIGYPIRLTHDLAGVSCHLGVGMLVHGFNANLLAITVYAVMVYVSIRYNLKKVKWWALIVSITTSWVISFVISVGVSSTVDIAVADGFCVAGDKTIRPVTIAFLVPNALTMFISITMVIIFDTMIFCYTRQNTIMEDNNEIKKAIRKILLFYSAKMFVFLLQLIVSCIVPLMRLSVKGFIAVIVIEYGLDVLYSGAALMTPISALIVLQPLRDAIKEISPCCCRQNSVHPAPTLVAEAKPVNQTTAL